MLDKHEAKHYITNDDFMVQRDLTNLSKMISIRNWNKKDKFRMICFLIATQKQFLS